MTEPSPPLEALRAAATELANLDEPVGDPMAFDPGPHAERFEAVHDALVSVLADIDQDPASGPGRT